MRGVFDQNVKLLRGNIDTIWRKLAKRLSERRRYLGHFGEHEEDGDDDDLEHLGEDDEDDEEDEDEDDEEDEDEDGVFRQLVSLKLTTSSSNLQLYR